MPSSTDAHPGARPEGPPQVSEDAQLSLLSHELRAPLTSISSGWQMARFQWRREAPATFDRELAGMIERGIERLEQAISNLEFFTQLDGKIPLLGVTTRVEVPRLLQDLAATYAPLARERSLALHLEVNLTMAPVVADRNLLRQAIQPLLDNAVKFTGPGGSIVLRARAEADALRVDVADTGIGIPDHLVPHITLPFVQAEPYLTRCYEGLGLGLALSRQLAAILGGTLEVSSVPGEGSCFSLKLPMKTCE